MARRVSSPEMVGRAAAVSALAGARRRAGRGAAGVVLVTGEAGIGKTRLVREEARRAAAQGWRVLWGECLPAVAGELPYAPLVGALRDDIGALLDDLAGPAPPARLRVFELLLGVLRRLAAEDPLLLVVEDLHWADRDSEDVLRFLVRNLAAERLLLVATWRDDEPGLRPSLSRLRAELHRSDRVESVALEPLAEDETGRQLRLIAGAAPPPARVAWVHERAQGNPFLVEELAAVDPAAGVPDELRRVLLARVEDVSPAARSVLGLAAAAGREVDHALLTAAGGGTGDAVPASLRELAEAGLLVGRAGRHAFRHALVREAAYEDLTPVERAAHHRALAAALEAAVPPGARGAADWAALAGHHDAAGDLPGALATALAAAEAALAVHAHEAAHHHLVRARELWPRVAPARRPDGVDEVELLRRLAEAARLTGRQDEALAVAEAALALADPARKAELHHLAGRMHRAPERALEHFDAALELLGPEPSRLRAAVLVWRVSARTHGSLTSEVAAWATEALDAARAAGARIEEARAHHDLGIAGCYGGDPAGGIGHFRECIRISADLGDAEVETRARGTLADCLLLLGRYDAAIAEADAGIARARETGLWHRSGLLVLNAADGELRLGRWEAARRRIDTALEAARSEDDRLMALAYAIALAAREGRIEDALAHEGEAQALASGNVHVQSRELTDYARMELALIRGDARAARALGAALRRDIGRGSLLDWPAMLTLALRAEADLGSDPAYARELADEVHWFGFEDPLGEDRAPPEVLAHWELADAELARLERRSVPEVWAGVARRWDALAMPYPAAYARWQEGQARAAAGDGAGAAAVLRRAAEQAAALGAAPLQRAIEAAARRLGAGRPFGLTDRELTVLGRLAAGATNRHIAEALVLSTRTVDMHVRNILFKLDAANRVEAAAIAHRHGIGIRDTAGLP